MVNGERVEVKMKIILNQNGGSRTDTLVKLVLVFFLSLLSFSVGTFVGKQFSDSQHKIADLESGSSDRVTASIPDTKPEPNHAISEEEIAKLSDEFVKKEKGEEAPSPSEPTTAKSAGEEHHGEEATAEAMTAPSKGKTDAAAIHDEINTIAKRLAAGEQRKPSSNEPAKAAPEKAVMEKKEIPKELAKTALGKFTVQVASQASESEAQRKVDELKGKGVSAFIVPAEINGKKWYRVSVGQFSDRNSAIAERTKLIEKTGIATAIVQKIAP